MADQQLGIEIRAGVQGRESVADLTRRLDDMATLLGGELGKQAKVAADRLRELTAQQEAISTFERLQAKARDAAAGLKAAEREAANFAAQISAAGPPTAQEAAALQRLQAQVETAQAALTQQQQAVAGATRELTRYGISSKDTQAAQQRLRGEVDQVRASVAQMTPSTQKAGAELTQFNQRATEGAAATQKLGERAGEARRLLGNMAAALTAGLTLRELVNAAAQMETLRAGLQAVSGSSEKAGQDLDFVRGVASRVGVDVAGAGKAFLGLSAATRGTAVEGEPTRQVFEAVASAMGKAGKSSAETQNALLALSQMASKGTVQMEELRGQLGEALPGALQATAKGLDITTEDLIKLVEAGQITATDLFPALSKGLNDLYGGAGAGTRTLAQQIGILKNSVTELGTSIGESGGLDALKKSAEIAEAAIVVLDATIVGVGKKMGALAGAIATWDFSQLRGEFTRIEAEAGDKLIKAAGHNEFLRNRLGLTADEAKRLADAHSAAATATQGAGAAAQAASGQWVKLNSDYGKVSEAIGKQIEQADRSRIAREAEGKAAMAMAQAFGTEAQQREAAVKATEADAQQLGKLAQLRTTDVEVLKAQLAALQALGAEVIKADPLRKKQVEELQKQIDLRQQDADKAVAQAQAGRLAAEQARAEAEAYRDNSVRVNELRAAYEAATAKLEELRRAKEAGKATQEQLTQAELAAGRAARLYRDALADQVKAIEAKAAVARANFSLEEAGLRLQIAQLQKTADIARARGDEKTAIQAQNEIRRLEIQLLELSAQAKRAEAEAQLAATAAKKAELIASGQYTGAKKLEIEAAELSAKVKLKEAEIAEVAASKASELARQLERGGKEASGAADGFRDAASGLNAMADAADRAAEAERKRRGVDKDGFATGKNGNTLVAGGDLTTLTGIAAFLKAAGVADDATARKIALEFADAQGNIPYFSNPGQIKYGGTGSTMSQALLKAAERYTFGGNAVGGAAAAPASTIPQQGMTVNINLGGKTSTIRVASQADRDALIALLRQLEEAMGTAA